MAMADLPIQWSMVRRDMRDLREQLSVAKAEAKWCRESLRQARAHAATAYRSQPSVALARALEALDAGMQPIGEDARDPGATKIPARVKGATGSLRGESLS